MFLTLHLLSSKFFSTLLFPSLTGFSFTDTCSYPSPCSTAASPPPATSAAMQASSTSHNHLLRRVFNMLDTDGDGLVTPYDLGRHLTELGTTADSLDVLSQLVQSTRQSTCGDASLDYDEFLRFYKEGDEELAEAFAIYDVDGDGFISCEELQQVLVRMGFNECRDEHVCHVIVQSVDANSDGKIDFLEFRQMMLPLDLE